MKYAGGREGKGFSPLAYDNTKHNAPPTKARWQSVACPTCDQPVDAECVSMGLRNTAKGTPCNPHPTRKRLAQSRWNKENL